MDRSENFSNRSNIISSAKLIELSACSNYHGLIRLAIHLLLLLATGWLVFIASNWWLVPAWLLYGSVLMFLFSPLHESIHNTAFRSRALNAGVATMAGFILFLPAQYFRQFHYAHHRYTNDPIRDPELATEKPKTRLQYLIALSGFVNYWLPQAKSIALHAMGRVNEDFIPEQKLSTIVKEARIHLILYAGLLGLSLFMQSSILLTYWIVPALIGSVSLRLFLLAEHAGCRLSGDMLENTRTTLTNPLVKLVSWNMPYHCEHHLYPSVPFHALPKLHKSLREPPKFLTPGYYRFHRDYLRRMNKRYQSLPENPV